MGAAGICGYFDWIFYLIPKAVVFPILIFIGLEITAQSFHATKARHYAAVALACVPALAYLALFALNQVLPELGKPFADLSPRLQHFVMTITVLSGSGGFIVTSLLWGTTLTHLIDGRVKPAAATLLLAGVCAWFGVIHSPLPSGPIAAPGTVLAQLETEGRARAGAGQSPYHWAAAYAAMAIVVLGSRDLASGQSPTGPRTCHSYDHAAATSALWPAARPIPCRRQDGDTLGYGMRGNCDIIPTPLAHPDRSLMTCGFLAILSLA